MSSLFIVLCKKTVIFFPKQNIFYFVELHKAEAKRAQNLVSETIEIDF